MGAGLAPARRAVLAAALLSGCADRGASSPDLPRERRLLWEDDFTGRRGSFPDPVSWTAELGGGGWGNDELQEYTDAPANVALDGEGHLVITARRAVPGDDSTWTSARITTFGKRTVVHGRVEVRARIAAGQGVWPAVWMLGADIQQVGWPACGEIDVLEAFGDTRTALHSLHAARTDGSHWYTTSRSVRERPLADEFHVYAVDWTAAGARFEVDGEVTASVSREALPPDVTWPFDGPQYLLLNVAVGGRLPGYPDAGTPDSVSTVVDRVRVYG